MRDSFFDSALLFTPLIGNTSIYWLYLAILLPAVNAMSSVEGTMCLNKLLITDAGLKFELDKQKGASTILPPFPRCQYSGCSDAREALKKLFTFNFSEVLFCTFLLKQPYEEMAGCR